MVIIFLALVKLHQKVEKKRALYKVLTENCKKQIRYLEGDLSDFSSGNKLLDKEHEFAFDLDIFGEASLFQHLNRSISDKGKKLIANTFYNPFKNEKDIFNTQNNIKALTKNIAFVIKFLAHGNNFDKIFSSYEINKFSEWLRGDKSLSNFIFKAYAYIFPVLNISLISVAEFAGVSYSFLSMVFVIQFSIYFKYYKKITQTQNVLSNKSNKLSLLKEIVSLKNKHFNDTECLKTISETNLEASKKLSELEKFANSLDNRNNFLAGLMLNWLFMWDFHCIIKIERWKNNNLVKFENWIDNLASLDMLCSFTLYTYNNPNLIFPVNSETGDILNSKNIKHPLMAGKSCIGNDIQISSEKMFIVTGPNMSGKSTFLRTVGLNMIMAKCGLPVSAEKFEFKPVNIFTSMRTVDSLSKHESYFFAELKKIKLLLHHLKSDNEYLVLLDELFKGTNSEDKLKGSQLLCKELLKHNCSSIVATHDLPLTEIQKESAERITNLCFEIEFKDDEMILDYKIREGVTKIMNATYLINKMGLS